MRTFVTVALLTAAGLFTVAAQEQDVRGAVDRFNEAARNGETAALDKLLAAGLVYVHSNAKVENKAQCIKALKETPVDFKVHPGLSVKFYGNTAVVHGQMTAYAKSQAAPVPLDVLQIWVKEGAAWLMVARHTSRLPQ